MTPKELIDRVRNVVDGAEVAGSERETNFAILSAGMTLAGIALNRMHSSVG